MFPLSALTLVKLAVLLLGLFNLTLMLTQRQSSPLPEARQSEYSPKALSSSSHLF